MKESGMIIREKQRPFLTFIFEVIVLLYIVHKILPLFGAVMPSVIYLALFALVFVFVVFLSLSKQTVSATIRLLVIFGVSLLELISQLFQGNFTSSLMYLYGETQIFLYALIAISFIYRGNATQIKKITNFTFVFYIITAITTFIGNNRYPDASRLLATLDNNDITRQLYAGENIGGFLFIYELVLIVPLLVYMVKKKRINRVVGMGIIALFGLTIFISEYTTALIMYILTLVLFLIPKITKRKMIVLIVLLVVLFLVNSLYFADLFEYLSQTLESETMAERFADIAKFLQSEETTGDGNVINRLDLYKKSIDTFFTSSMLGVWKNSGIGGHSFVFDTMGKFGILGIVAMIFMYRMIYKMFISPYRREDFYPYLFFIYMIALFMAFINPKTYLFIFIFLIPMFAQKQIGTRIEREGF